LHAKSLPTTGRPPVPRPIRREFVLRLIGCFVLVALSSTFVDFFCRGNSGMGADLIWVSNGVLLAYLLLTPRWHWIAYCCVGLAAQVAGAILLDGRVKLISLAITALNISEALIAAFLLRRRSSQLPRFTDAAYLARFLAYGVVAAPLTAGAGFALMAFLTHRQPPQSAFLSWLAEDSLGIAVATPAFVAVLRDHFRNSLRWSRSWVYPTALAVATVAAFTQTTVPLLFVLYPLMVLMLLRMGLAWAMVGLLFVSVTSGLLTHLGMGPFAALARFTTVDPGVLLQLFMATGMFILYSVSVVMERQKKIERQLQEIATLHSLVTENSRDVIILADFNGRRHYVSSAAESMGGWKPEELMKMGSLDLVHPLDLAKTMAVLDELHNGAEFGTLEVRVRKVTGDYLWVESVLRVIHDPKTGAPTGLLNTVRDITERKQANQQLQEAYNAVEALAVTDALTGLANRRKFDQYLTSEWRRSMRDHQPLSVLMIDADKFKSYNDTYGHPRGDSCLKQIAEACLDVVSRPGDLVARFGGEEFVVVLPNTVNEGAMQVAEEICESMRRRCLPHTGNTAGIVTISIGCATLVPKLGQHAPDLLEMADKALYQAKNNGRNQACNGNLLTVATVPAKADEAASHGSAS